MKTILEIASEVVDGPRQESYGSPDVNHGRTACLWSAYLAARTEGMSADEIADYILNLTAEDVCWLNILQKVSRDMNAPSHDTLVDVAGYSRNIEIIRDKEAQ